MINLGKLVQHKSNNKFKMFGQFGDELLMWLDVCFLLFSFYWRLLSVKHHVSQKTYKKIPPTKMITLGITIIKNDSNAHCFMQYIRSYLSVKTFIISKPFNWFAKQVNCLVSIRKYFRTDYNIVCVQGNVHGPLVSSSYNHLVKMIFFTRCTAHVHLNG